MIGSRAFAASEDTTCTPSATTINFGSYDVLGGGALTSAGSFTVTCTHNKTTNVSVTYTAKLTNATRLLAPPSGTDNLSYQLYTNNTSPQTVWLDGTGGTGTFSATLALNGAVSVTGPTHFFYGAILENGKDISAVSPGPAPTIYSQVLTITVTCTPSSAGC
jgi:spore coat protein U-like protein